MMRGWLAAGLIAVAGCDAPARACDEASPMTFAQPDDDGGDASTSAQAMASSDDGDPGHGVDTGAPPPADDDDGDGDDGPPQLEPAAPSLRMMTFNIRHGAESSLEEVAAVVREHAPDIVALQEVDKEAARSDLVFQSYRLGQLTGMASLFRNALVFPEGGEYGLAVLSRFPILASEKVALTSATEPRVLVIVEIEVDAAHVLPIAITHLGLDPDERVVQAQEIVSALDDRPWAVLMGDLNAQPSDAPLRTLGGAFVDAWSSAGRGEGFTFPATDPDRRIDYVMLDEAWAMPTDVYVPTTTASDHRPIVVALPWPDR